MRSPTVPIPVLLAAAIVTTVPLWVSGYPIRVLTMIFQWGAMAGAWNLLVGYTGALDLGPVAPYGVGAFSVAIFMTRLEWAFLPSLVAATGIAAVVAYVIGGPTFRLRGAYFAVGTLALAEALKELFLSWDRVTGIRLFGGSGGISLPLTNSPNFFFYVLFAILCAVVATGYSFERSKFGFGLKALRDSETVAAATGVPVFALKRKVYMISSAFLAVVGGTSAYWLSYINASDSLSTTLILQMIAMAVIGGLGTPLGPLVGAALVVLFQDWLGARFVYTYAIILGLFIVVVALFFPRGIAGMTRSLYERMRRSRAWAGEGVKRR